MDYLNFSNDARTVARKIAVMDEDERKETFSVSENGVTSYSKAYETKFASFYNVTRTVSLSPVNSTKPVDVVVTVNFERNNADLPNVLKWVGFPPEKVRPIEYHMKLEYNRQNQTT